MTDTLNDRLNRIVRYAARPPLSADDFDWLLRVARAAWELEQEAVAFHFNECGCHDPGRTRCSTSEQLALFRAAVEGKEGG